MSIYKCLNCDQEKDNDKVPCYEITDDIGVFQGFTCKECWDEGMKDV